MQKVTINQTHYVYKGLHWHDILLNLKNTIETEQEIGETPKRTAHLYCG